MRYELQNNELAIFFAKDEVNVALSYENAMHSARGVSSGELIYACLVDSINEKTGTPAIDWRARLVKADHPDRAFPDSMDARDGMLVVNTLRGESVAVSSAA